MDTIVKIPQYTDSEQTEKRETFFWEVFVVLNSLLGFYSSPGFC